MRIPSELVQLSRLFPSSSPLYVVGGAVRDSLLNIDICDYDIASALTVTELKSLLSGSIFKTSGEFPRTGTLVIVAGNFKAEYTTFRTDSYPSGNGAHAPDSVIFTTDINLDANRRDFSCNAIYYDIAHDMIVDPLGGMNSIRERTIYTAREPSLVLQEDALRIMRIARLACELGFHIDPDVLREAKFFATQLKDISIERITNELIKILECKNKYKDSFLPSYGISLLNDLGVNDYIFRYSISLTTLLAFDKLKLNGTYKAGLSQKLALLFHGIPLDIIEARLNYLKLSKAIIRETLAIASGLKTVQAVELDRIDYSQLKWLIIKNYAAIYDIIGIRMARGEECEPIMEALHIVNSLDLPLKIADLKINGDMVMSRGVTGERVGTTLSLLFERSVNEEATDYDNQLAILDEIL